MSQPGLHVRERDGRFAAYRDDERLTDWVSLCAARGKIGQMQRAEREAARRKTRKCLCCGREFQSEGPGHRLCDLHRRTIGSLGREMV